MRPPVAFEDGRAGSPVVGDECHRLRCQHLLGGGTISGAWLDHPFDEVVQRMRFIRIQHEAGRAMLRPLLRTEEVARVMCRSKGEGAAAGADPKPNLLVVCDLGDARVVFNWQAVGIASNRTRFAACERRDRSQVARSESLPSRAVVGKEHVAGNLEDNEAEGENVGRLVVLSAQNLGGNVLAVTFALNALGSWPRSRQAEVADLEVTIERDEDVGRLDIKMDETSLVNSR